MFFYQNSLDWDRKIKNIKNFLSYDIKDKGTSNA